MCYCVCHAVRISVHCTFLRKILHIPTLAFSSLFWSEDGFDGVLAFFLLNSGHPAPRQQSTEHMLAVADARRAHRPPKLLWFHVRCRHLLQDSSVFHFWLHVRRFPQ